MEVWSSGGHSLSLAPIEAGYAVGEGGEGLRGEKQRFRLHGRSCVIRSCSFREATSSSSLTEEEISRTIREVAAIRAITPDRAPAFDECIRRPHLRARARSHRGVRQAAELLDQRGCITLCGPAGR